MSAENPSPSIEVIEAAAAAWLSLRDRGMTSEETAGFVHWLQQDERHTRIFDELDRTWESFDRLAALPATTTVPPDADLLAPRGLPRRHRQWHWAVLGAAAAAIVLLTGIPYRSTKPTAETLIGALQKLDLPDGSVAQLNTNTAIETTYTSTERRVHIVRGEAFFSVKKDPTRPFIVTSGRVAVRAVGTAFNVRQHDDFIEVLVAEGQVRVDDADLGLSLLPLPETGPSASHPVLAAGERLFVPMVATPDASPRIERISPLAVQRVLAWQERRLEFESTPLAEIVREFNRYNRQQLVLDDPELATRPFSGTFRADGYESFVRLLEADFNVKAINQGSTIVLQTRR